MVASRSDRFRDREGKVQDTDDNGGYQQIECPESFLHYYVHPVMAGAINQLIIVAGFGIGLRSSKR